MPKLPYDPSYVSFITTVTKNRRPIFRDPKLAERLGTMIHMACQAKGFVPLAYAIVPDHVHLLVCSSILLERALEKTRSADSGVSHTTFPKTIEGGFSKPPVFTIGNFVQSFKGTFSRTTGPGHIWQPGYFNWYMTDPRDLLRTTQYIINNYRKTNLPDAFGRQPYVWSNDEQLGCLLS